MINAILTFFNNIFSSSRSIRYTVFSGFGLSCLVLLFIPIKSIKNFQSEWNTQLIVVTIICICFIIMSLIIDSCEFYKILKNTNKNLKLILHENECWYYLAKQNDKRIFTQISLTANISNLTDRPIAIVKARIIKPRMNNSDLLHAEVLLPQAGSPFHSHEYKIPPHNTVRASVHIMVPKQLAIEKSKLKLTVGIIDELGTEYKLKCILKAV